MSPRPFLRAVLLRGSLVAFAALASFGAAAPTGNGAPAKPAATVADGPRVLLGIDVLEANNFDILHGKRVGLLTNQTGVDRKGVSTIDVLRRAPGVKLVALYAPEHGLYGEVPAGETVGNQTDKRTGLPVFSLFNDKPYVRKPTPEMLAGIDTLVVDLQDIGTRSYTFVSCVAKTMEACFEQGKEIIVLDRPNPLGGLRVGGPILEKQFQSYVGEFPVPYAHGLTIGELAKIAQANPGWLDVTDEVRAHGKLIVVAMRGWRRSMLWPDTGLRWVQTSPKVPDPAAAFGYNLTGLGGQIGDFSNGANTRNEFRLLNFPGKTPQELAAALRALPLAGLDFKPISYPDPTMKDPDPKRRVRSGVYVVILDWNAVDPSALSFYMMQLAAAWNPTGNPFALAKGSPVEMYNKLVGSAAWWTEISKKGGKADVAGFVRQWDADAARFQLWSRKWWLYPV